MTQEIKVHPFEKAGLGKAPFRCVGFDVRKYQACYGAPVQPGASCDYCGTGIMNVYTIESSDKVKFIVGCDCVAKTGDHYLKTEIRKVRRVGLVDARNKARKLALEQTAAIKYKQLPEEVRTALENCEHDIVKDIAKKVKQYGSISEKQSDLVLRLYYSDKQIGCERPPTCKIPQEMIGQRVKLCCLILGTKYTETRFGEQLKMLVEVRTAAGVWKAWSTVPSGLRGDELRGKVVNICAKVESSKDDPTFAFLNRPTLLDKD